MTGHPTKTHTYKGWAFWQLQRGRWALVRLDDRFTTHHTSLHGCRLFIRDHGTASDPDASYETWLAA